MPELTEAEIKLQKILQFIQSSNSILTLDDLEQRIVELTNQRDDLRAFVKRVAEGTWANTRCMYAMQKLVDEAQSLLDQIK